MHFKMSSAIYLNLDQSKILSSGNGLTIYMVTEIEKLEDLSQFKTGPVLIKLEFVLN